MFKRILTLSLTLLLTVTAFPQDKPQNPGADHTIRISTELVQMDVVVTDRNGRIVKGLSKDDFEIYEKGKRQPLSFLEFVEAVSRSKPVGETAESRAQQSLNHDPTEKDIRRIFAFVIDDLTVRFDDLIYVRQMLSNFVEKQMQPTDLVAIVRTVGGKGLLQQFTTDKDLLRRAIVSLLPVNHPLSVSDELLGDRPLINQNAGQGAQSNRLQPTSTAARAAAESAAAAAGESLDSAMDVSGDVIDINSVADDSDKSLRAFMTLGMASFVIDSMEELPGRKSLVLISGGLPLLDGQSGSTVGRVSSLLNLLTDNATRAAVSIHTMDIRGVTAYGELRSIDDLATPNVLPPTPTGSAGGGGLDMGGTRRGGSRTSDARIKAASVVDLNTLGNRSAFTGRDTQEGLKSLAHATGGISIVNTNNFNQGLERILATSEGYYLVAYTPSDAKFDGDFRKVEVKVKGEGLKVHSRRGYFARAAKETETVSDKRGQLLAAIKSPLARRDVDLDAVLLYKATASDRGSIDIHMVIDTKKLQFDQADNKYRANLDVAAFVFDEFGKLRGGFSDSIKPDLSPDQFKQAARGGLTYTASTSLPSGVYHMKLVVRDNETGALGTLSRYLEVPDLSKGRLAASSLLLGAVPADNNKASNANWVLANRRISRKHNLLFATVIYNAKFKDGKPQVTTQLTVSHLGRVILKSTEEAVPVNPQNTAQLLKLGQLKVSSIPSGRYLLTLTIKDSLADKKAQTLSRKIDFMVVD